MHKIIEHYTSMLFYKNVFIDSSGLGFKYMKGTVLKS